MRPYLPRLLRFAFHLLYHQLAFAYDVIAWTVSAGLWKSWVLSMVPRLEACDRILEIGHGPGHLQLALAEAGRAVSGVDLSPQMARIAQRRLLEAGVLPRIALADARRLPFSARHFDAVVATFPAEYIAERETWDSILRVLAPGGRILVLLGANPLGRTPLHLLSRLLFRVTGQQIQGAEGVIRQRLEASIGDMGVALEVKSANVRRSMVFYLEGRNRD